MKLKKYVFKNIKAIMLAILALSLFVFSSWLSHRYALELRQSAFSRNIWGELAYFAVSVVSIIIAGLSASPLIPLAYALWGAAKTILFTSLGWSIGSAIAFLLARRYGEKLVCRLVNVCDFEDYKNNINPRGLFFQLMLARIFLPVDILSYAVGLFTNMPLWKFVSATWIGSAIFTWLAIYASELPVWVQVMAGIAVLLVFFAWLQRIIKSIILKKTK